MSQNHPGHELHPAAGTTSHGRFGLSWHRLTPRTAARCCAVTLAASLVGVLGVLPSADASTFVGDYASIYAGNGHGGTPVPGPASATPTDAGSVAVDPSGDVYVAAAGRYNVVEKIAPDGTMSIFAGNGQTGTPTAGPATATPVKPYAIAADSSGNVYIADADGYIEKVTPSGTLSIITGAITRPYALTVATTGDLYVADLTNDTVKKVTPSGVVTIVAGNGTLGAPVSGPATASPLTPDGLAVDSSGNVYEADASYHVTKISPAGTLSVIAGNGGSGYPTPPTPGPATASSGVGRFVAVDTSGNVFTGADSYVDEVSPTGTLTVLSGQGQQQPTATPVPASSTWFDASDIALDSSGNLFAAAGDVILLAPHYADPPGATGEPVAVKTNGQVSLTWAAPTNDGGSTVTGYEVRESTDGGTTWSTATWSSSSPLFPSGLTDGTAYQFEVAATNRVGTGPWSTPSVPVTPEPTITPTTPSTWVVSALTPSSTTLAATGGTGGYTWSLKSGPTGLTISPSGVLSADFEPTETCWNEPCTFTYTYTISDTAGDTFTHPASVVVNPGPVYFRTSHTLPSTTLGAPYEQAIKVGRGWGIDGFTIVGGSLPAHVSLVANLGKQYTIITGRATTTGRFAVKVRAVDSHNHAIYSWFYITVT